MEEELDYPQFEENLIEFLNHLEALNETLPLTLALISIKDKHREKELSEFIDVKSIKKEKAKIEDTTDTNEIEEEDLIRLKIEDSTVFEELQRNKKISALAFHVIPESLFVALISQFDAFIGKLIKIIFEIHPEKLNSSEKNIAFNQLSNFASISDVKDFIIEKEVESILRESHTYHFEWLEKKLQIPLRKNLPIWKRYIEITERRNLFVHNHGHVSNQYINVCKLNEVQLDKKTKIGNKLTVDIPYFQSAYECLYEIAVKLTHVVWRKLITNDLEASDDSLNNICLDLIQNEQYVLADIILEFSCETLKKHHNELSFNVFIINCALSKYLQGNKSGSNVIIDKIDWSAKSHNFQLAVEVLKENYEEAYHLMQIVAKAGEIPRHAFQTWPLFKVIRNEHDFKLTYKEIYNEDFNVIERPTRATIKILEKQNNKVTVKKPLIANKLKQGESDLKKANLKFNSQVKNNDISNNRA